MIKSLIVYVLFLGFCFDSTAQSSLKAVFRVNEFDSSSVIFFNKYPEVGRIVLEYKNGHALQLDIYSAINKLSENIPVEKYFLTFDGDVHLFNKKYPQFSFRNSSRLIAKYIDEMEDVTKNDTLYTLKTTFRPDSLTHFFKFYSINDVPEYDFGRVSNRPYLKQGILELTDTLQQCLKSWKSIIISDSIIVMSGTVEKNGSLSNLQLLAGDTSPYSKKIMQELITITQWWPVRLGGKALPWPVKISVRVNPDHTLKVGIL